MENLVEILPLLQQLVTDLSHLMGAAAVAFTALIVAFRPVVAVLGALSKHTPWNWDNNAVNILSQTMDSLHKSAEKVAGIKKDTKK